jgi:hypothetical protein
LYKYEGDSLNLDDYVIASRLSYFLWNSLPDDRLIKLASEGKLKDSSVRSAEALRMLQAPKAQRFSANFTEQWLELDKVDIVNPHDDILTHTFGDRRGAKISQLKPFLMQEGIEFLKVILNENLSLLNFIDSDFVVINRPLKHSRLKTILMSTVKTRTVPPAIARWTPLVWPWKALMFWVAIARLTRILS